MNTENRTPKVQLRFAILMAIMAIGLVVPALRAGDLSAVGAKTGQFIWSEGEANPFQFYLFARRDFQLATVPASARLQITASDRYVLYVNGTYLGRGPARSDPRHKNFDTYDVASYLKPGHNAIAVRAYHYGNLRGGGWNRWNGDGYTVGERAGLWAELETKTSEGKKEIIGTDDAWRVLPARAWNRAVKPINVLVGNTEIYDASADPLNWMATDFDDSAWAPAWVIPQRELEWSLLESRDIPMLVEEEAFPTRVVSVGEVLDQGHGKQTDIPEFLNEEIHFPLENAVVKDQDTVLRQDGRWAEFQSAYIREQGIRAPYIIVDFGCQVFGFPRIRLSASKGTFLDMNYGQQLIAGRIPPALRYGDRYIAREGEQTWDLGDYKQFRYLFLAVRSLDAPVRIESISLNQYGYPVEQRGRFECSDSTLTKVWQASVDTTYLQLEDTLVSDAYRERVPWSTGDASHGILAVYMAYGALPVTDHFLRSFLLSDRGEGMLQMGYPPENPMNYIIPQFLLWWSTRVKEQFLYAGRRATLEQLYQSVQRQIDWYEPYRDEMGLLRGLAGQNWLDWTPNDMRGANFSTNALYVNSLEDAAWIATQMGNTRDAERWTRIAGEVRTTLRKVFWNSEKGLYEDSYYHGSLTGVDSEMANGCALDYDIATDDQVASIGKHLSTQSTDIVEVTPLYFGYVVDGLLKRGLAQNALDLMRVRFGPMMNSTDHPTIWEGWGPYTENDTLDTDAAYLHRRRIRPAGVRSLVHTGGVMAGYVLSTRILGVLPTAPGFAKCRIQPHTGDLDWAKGLFPTPHGDIKVEWKREAGKLNLTTEIPEGIEAEVVLDRDPAKAQTLPHNGTKIALKTIEKSSKSGIKLDAKQVRLVVEGGAHSIEWGE